MYIRNQTQFTSLPHLFPHCVFDFFGSGQIGIPDSRLILTISEVDFDDIARHDTNLFSKHNPDFETDKKKNQNKVNDK